MLAPNIDSEVKALLEKKGKGGWLRAQECSKEYAKDPITGALNHSSQTKFYRWRKQVEKGKIPGFQIFKLPGNFSWIGLESSDPKTLESLISEDRKLTRSAKSSFGFFEWLNQRAARKRHEEKERRKQHLLGKIHYQELLAETNPETLGIYKKVAKKDREMLRRLEQNDQ